MSGLGGLIKSPGRPDEIVTAEVRPDLVRVRGGEGWAGDCPYTYMHDLVAGRYRLPWEDEVVHVDGASCGFPPPERRYAPAPSADIAKKTA
jgi:formamidase